MSGSAKWSLNFTEDGIPVYPPGFPSTEHDTSGSGISIIALVVICILAVALIPPFAVSGATDKTRTKHENEDENKTQQLHLQSLQWERSSERE
jgi:hypothetical protein